MRWQYNEVWWFYKFLNRDYDPDGCKLLPVGFASCLLMCAVEPKQTPRETKLFLGRLWPHNQFFWHTLDRYCPPNHPSRPRTTWEVCGNYDGCEGIKSMTSSLDSKSGWSCIRHALADAITESTFNASPLTPCTDSSNGSFHSVNQQACVHTQTRDRVRAHTRNGHLCDDSSSLKVSGVDWVQFSMSSASSECETVHHHFQAEHFF